MLLCRRLRFPMPRTWRCGRLLDVLGHHRGVLGRRGYALECAAAQVCREAGGRISTNVTMRDLDIPSPHGAVDGCRLEIIVDGLPLFDGAQLALDTTVVHRDGTAKRGASARDGAVLQDTRRRKEMTCPELNGAGGRASIVVLAAELGG